MQTANKIRTWKPVPLPLDFQLALESGNWAKALKIYQGHPYSAPPLDTFELMKLLFYKTPLSHASVRAKFEAKVKVNLAMKQRAPEQIEWGVFWEALNRGDSRVVSMSLSGARVNGLSNQCGVAESCAVLLRTEGREWRQNLVENLPFSTVTANNLVSTTFVRGRWDLALEMLDHVRLSRADVANLWPTVSCFHWAVALAFVTAVPRHAVPFDKTIPSLLSNGCSLPVLAEHMERSRALNDVNVVAPLLEHAVTRREIIREQHEISDSGENDESSSSSSSKEVVQIEEPDYDFAERCMHHLVDIDAISHAAMAFFGQLCETHGTATVFETLRRAGIPLHKLTVENLESLRFVNYKKYESSNNSQQQGSDNSRMTTSSSSSSSSSSSNSEGKSTTKYKKPW